MPHLSLYYGKQKALEKKQRLCYHNYLKYRAAFMAETFYLVSFDPKNIEWKILK